MKLKNVLLGAISMLLTLPVFSQDLLLTGVFDGPLTGGTPKAFEFYVVNDITDLSLYGVGVANNGGGSDGLEYSFPADAYTAGEFIYLTNNDVEFNTWFGFDETYLDGVANVNGDDAIEVYFNGAVYDVFGDVVPDGTGEPWEYLDTWFYRVDGTTANTTWQASDWTSPGLNANDNQLDNTTATNPFPTGTYSATAGTIFGCTNMAACNFNVNATQDDGTCELPGDACDDGDSLTENDVLQGDCSCAGTAIVTCDPILWTGVTVTANSDGDEWIDNGDGSYTANGFCGGGCMENIDLWLVSAGFDFSGVVTSDFIFDLAESFGATTLDLQYTTSYMGDPTASTWTSLGTYDAAGSFSVDLSSLAGLSEIYLAFQYADDGMDGYSGFTLSNLNFTGDCPTDLTVFDCPVEMANFGDPCDDMDATTNNDVIQNDCSCAGTPFVITNDLMITAVYDGTLSGGFPKGVELLALNSIADLSNFGIGSANNGGGTDGEEFSFPAISLAAGEYVFVSNDDNSAQSYFASTATNINAGASMNVNGDDALELFEFGQVIDVFGDINASGSGTAWDYLDSWAHRNCEQMPNGGTFDPNNWSYGGPNVLDNAALNSDSSNPMPVGAYEATCPTVILGCTNTMACNYNMNATQDDGTCELPGDACDDGDSLTENDVLQGDCSCAGTPVVTCDPIIWTGVTVTANSDGDEWIDNGDGSYTANGFCGGGCMENIDLWLVSSGFDFSAATSTDFIFDLAESFGATTLDLQYTSSYNGDPTASTWTSLGTYDAAGSYSVDLSSLAGSSEIYLAFQYADDGVDGYSGFTLSNINFTGDCPTDLTVFDCPTEMANFGDPCDDMDAMTNNDIIQGDCSCAGTPFVITNDLILTAVFDGSLSGGQPKGVEIYVVNNIADLSVYGLASITNGGGSPGQEFAFPADAATAGDFIYVAANETDFTTFFGFAPTYADGVVGINGDDAIELYEQGTVIDTFGQIDTDGTGTAWEYQDGWAYRNCETGPDGTFVEANWSFSGVNGLEGGSDNATADMPMPIGTYETTCSAMTGCTDENASNYDENAMTDDGSCEYLGCTDPDFVEFNPYAQTDDGSCATLIVEGCIYDSADNYDPAANVDNNTCVFSGNSCPGDFNDDGAVNVADLGGFLGAFGSLCD